MFLGGCPCCGPRGKCINDPYDDFWLPLINEIITLETFESGRFTELFQFTGIDLDGATAQMVPGGGNSDSLFLQSLLITLKDGTGSIKLMPNEPLSLPSFPYYGWQLEVLRNTDPDDSYQLQYQFKTEVNIPLLSDPEAYHLRWYSGNSYAIDKSGGGGSDGPTQSWSQDTGYSQVLLGCGGQSYDPTPTGVTNPWLRVTVNGVMRPRVCGGCGWQCSRRRPIGSTDPSEREYKCTPGSEENECYRLNGVQQPESRCWTVKSTYNTEEECHNNCCDTPPCTTGGRAMPTKTTGPGTELANLLKWFGIKAKEKGCGCKSMQKKMDKGGPQWCRDNKEEILTHLEKEAKKRGLPFVKLAASKLLDLAIRRSERGQ